MNERHDFTDETKWCDQALVDYHNDLVDILTDDPMPRLAKQAMAQLAIVRFEIDERVIEIVEED